MERRLSEPDGSSAPSTSTTADDGQDNSAGERTPLLDIAGSKPSIVDDAALQHTVMAICALLLIAVEASQLILGPPTQEILERNICRHRYPDYQLRNDLRCKSPDVQRTLALVRSWSVAAEMAISLVVQVPYGIIADKFGRRTVLFLSLLGCVLQTAWTIVVLLLPRIFSVWVIVFGTVSFAIGGGGQMASAMIWTIITDVTPVAKRTTVFYRLQGFYLSLGVVFSPVAAFLLSIDAWLTMWLGFGLVVVGALTALLVPETLVLHAAAVQGPTRHDSLRPATQNFPCLASQRAGRLGNAWSALRDGAGNTWRFVFGTKRIMILVLAYSLYYPTRLNMTVNLLQYMTTRFDWKWSTAAYISSVNNVTSVTLLLFILPGASSIIATRCHYDTLSRDLLLTRVSIVVAVAGGIFLALAAVPWLFVASLIVTSLGTGFGPLSRAMLNAIVEPGTVATLNVTLSTFETLVSLVGAPLLGWLLSRGLELGGLWTGLPHVVTAGCSVLALIAVFSFRQPSKLAQVQD